MSYVTIISQEISFNRITKNLCHNNENSKNNEILLMNDYNNTAQNFFNEILKNGDLGKLYIEQDETFLLELLK